MVRFPNVWIVLPMVTQSEHSENAPSRYVRPRPTQATQSELPSPGWVVPMAILIAEKTDFHSCVNQKLASRDLVSYEKQVLYVAGCHGPH